MAGRAKKTTHRENFLRGFSRVLVLAPKREYRTAQRGGFARDARAMREDFIHVARDMGYTVRKYGEG